MLNEDTIPFIVTATSDRDAQQQPTAFYVFLWSTDRSKRLVRATEGCDLGRAARSLRAQCCRVGQATWTYMSIFFSEKINFSSHEDKVLIELVPKNPPIYYDTLTLALSIFGKKEAGHDKNVICLHQPSTALSSIGNRFLKTSDIIKTKCRASRWRSLRTEWNFKNRNGTILEKSSVRDRRLSIPVFNWGMKGKVTFS